MDNTKTGLLIKELRKEKDMTQKELADILHVTDKAVSKWERGLCARDISLLEPLSKALDISIVELIKGEHIFADTLVTEAGDPAKRVIDYSKNEIAYKTKLIKKKAFIIAASGIVLAALICLLCLWRSDYFYTIDKIISPDKNTAITVYDRDIFDQGNSHETATAILAEFKDGGELRINYGKCVYQGLWWAPDSTKYVVSLKDEDGVHLLLASIENGTESNLNAYLSMGVKLNELSVYDLRYDEIEYQFLQWSLDSSSMLIYYAFIDINKEENAGYFWFNCDNGNISSAIELDIEKSK